MFYKVALFVLFALYVHQGSPLMCKVCNSLIDGTNCTDKVDTTVLLQDCVPELVKSTLTWMEGQLKKMGVEVPDSKTSFVCFKLVREKAGKQTVIRGCNLAKTDKFDYCQEVVKQEPQTGKLVSCDTCSSDGCNESSVLAPWPSTLLLLTLPALLAAGGVTDGLRSVQ